MAERPGHPRGAAPAEDARVTAALPYLNPGRFIAGRPLVQGMRVALSAEVTRTHEELIERIVHAGLAYADTVDPETSLVICNDPNPSRARAIRPTNWACRWSAMPISCGHLDTSSAASASKASDTTLAGEQFALFYSPLPSLLRSGNFGMTQPLQT